MTTMARTPNGREHDLTPLLAATTAAVLCGPSPVLDTAQGGGGGSERPPPKRRGDDDLREAVDAGLLLVVARGSGTVELDGARLTYDPELPVETRAPLVRAAIVQHRGEPPEPTPPAAPSVRDRLVDALVQLDQRVGVRGVRVTLLGMLRRVLRLVVRDVADRAKAYAAIGVALDREGLGDYEMTAENLRDVAAHDAALRALDEEGEQPSMARTLLRLGGSHDVGETLDLLQGWGRRYGADVVSLLWTHDDGDLAPDPLSAADLDAWRRRARESLEATTRHVAGLGALDREEALELGAWRTSAEPALGMLAYAGVIRGWDVTGATARLRGLDVDAALVADELQDAARFPREATAGATSRALLLALLVMAAHERDDATRGDVEALVAEALCRISGAEDLDALLAALRGVPVPRGAAPMLRAARELVGGIATGAYGTALLRATHAAAEVVCNDALARVMVAAVRDVLRDCVEALDGADGDEHARLRALLTVGA